MNEPTVERAHWERVAPRWVAGGARIRRMTRAVTRALVDALAPASGDVLLDLASGVGDPALELAARVAPRGRVIACDAVADMTTALAQHAPANLRVVRCTAEQPAFRDGSFDALACRFGAMFLAHPERALARWRRVLRPGGRAAVVVWAAAEHNPYFSVVGEVLDAAGAPPAELANPGRGIFEFGDGERLPALLHDAGFHAVEQRAVEFSMELPDTTPHTLLDAQRALSPLIAQRTESLDAATLHALRRAVALVAEPWAGPEGLAIPARAWLLTARAPGPDAAAG